MSQHFDALVVGAGPVGLFMANELMRHGLSCKIIDKKSGLSTQSKALGIHIRTLEAFYDTGIIDDVLARGHKVHGVLFKSKGKVIADNTFGHVDALYDYLIDLPQDETEAVLNEHLIKKGNAVEWNTELLRFEQDTHGVTATIKNAAGQESTISADWLIACDGSHSTARQLLNIDFVGAEYKEKWWLADIYIDWELPNDRMVIYLADNGPTACFPMNNHRYRLVMAAPKSNIENPSFDDIKNYFAKYCPDKATLRDPLWITAFYLHHRQIQQYRKDRVFFAGDAAHIHSPMGGQGMNTGIQDTYNLAWKLALVQKKIAPPDILDSYHAERYPVGKKVLHETDKMTKMVLVKNPIATFFRNKVLSLVSSFDKVKDNIMNNMAQLTIAYEDSPLVEQYGKLAIQAGTLIPNINLQAASGRSQRLFDIVKGTQHHLFLFAGVDNSLQLEEAQKIAVHLPSAIIVHLVGNGEKPAAWSGNYWRDVNQTAQQKIGAKQSVAMLVRPDKYIGFLQIPFEAKTLQDYLAKVFVF